MASKLTFVWSWCLLNFYHKLAGRLEFQITGNDWHYAPAYLTKNWTGKKLMVPITLMIGTQHDGSII